MKKNEILAKHCEAFKPLFEQINKQFEKSPMTQKYYVHFMDVPFKEKRSMIDKKHVRFIKKMLEELYGYNVQEKSEIRTICDSGAVRTEEENYLLIDLV